MRLTILFILFCNSLVECQNLVPNPSFEEINGSISGFTDNDTEFTSKIKSWTTPNTASPDLITPDFKEAYIIPPPAHNGSNMVGIQFNKMDWAEYVGVNLKRPLTPNKTYYVAYWIRKSYCKNPKMNVDQMLDKNFGILFSNDSIKTSNNKHIIATPQIQLDTQLLLTYKKWIKVSKYFTPKSNYDRLYIGQFLQEEEASDEKMGYFVIDDVIVKELTDFASINKNTELAIGTKIPLKHIHFKTGTTELKDEQSLAALNELAAYLHSNSTINIQINGHTDSAGSEQSNLSLSKKRAKFIAQKVIENSISKKRIKWKGFGEAYPIADNNTQDGKSKNRRVEFEVIE